MTRAHLRAWVIAVVVVIITRGGDGAAVVGTALLFGGVGVVAELVLADIGSGRSGRRKMQN